MHDSVIGQKYVYPIPPFPFTGYLQAEAPGALVIPIFSMIFSTNLKHTLSSEKSPLILKDAISILAPSLSNL
jgi:hypothetical protein